MQPGRMLSSAPACERDAEHQCTLEELSVLCMCNDAEGASPLCNRAPAMRLAANDLRMMRTTENSA